MKTCTSVSLPEQFGVQFFKVHKDTTLSRPQEDPLDFLTFWTAYRVMVRERKVKRKFFLEEWCFESQESIMKSKFTTVCRCNRKSLTS